ncbi:MAG TPA: hypothetical protein VHY08_27885, partial [Bacillota bacterium]|nr:hypothetical protein [Bacillota bacterium]
EICRTNPVLTIYTKCFKRVSEIVLNPTNNEENLRKYQEAYRSYYRKYIQDKEYFFENYLVDYVFKNVLPYSNSENVFESYVELIIHYALIKFHLIIKSGINKEINDSLVIQVVQKVSKSFDHNKRFLNQLYQGLRSSNFLSLACMVILFIDP